MATPKTVYILSKEKQAPIGDGYDVAMADRNWCKEQLSELSALLKYKDPNMLEVNYARAMADIDSVIDNMNGLKIKIDNAIK